MKKTTKPDPNNWTNEELATIPQTDQVFEKPHMKLNDHTWIQEGYTIIDTCPACPRYGIPIPQGHMLVKDEKGYRLVNEITRK